VTTTVEILRTTTATKEDDNIHRFWAVNEIAKTAKNKLKLTPRGVS